ncbi:hypothetical protein [Sphingomonas sp.]|uniref:hypothetical protein n=1 Tax=Sphingomonas sp. TaxID=28214 RepID=UPI003F714E63
MSFPRNASRFTLARIIDLYAADKEPSLIICPWAGVLIHNPEQFLGYVIGPFFAGFGPPSLCDPIFDDIDAI